MRVVDDVWGGELDILVSNAGGGAGPAMPWHEVGEETWIAS